MENVSVYLLILILVDICSRINCTSIYNWNCKWLKLTSVASMFTLVQMSHVCNIFVIVLYRMWQFTVRSDLGHIQKNNNEKVIWTEQRIRLAPSGSQCQCSLRPMSCSSILTIRSTECAIIPHFSVVVQSQVILPLFWENLSFPKICIKLNISF